MCVSVCARVCVSVCVVLLIENVYCRKCSREKGRMCEYQRSSWSKREREARVSKVWEWLYARLGVCVCLRESERDREREIVQNRYSLPWEYESNSFFLGNVNKFSEGSRKEKAKVVSSVESQRRQRPTFTNIMNYSEELLKKRISGTFPAAIHISVINSNLFRSILIRKAIFKTLNKYLIWGLK